MIDDAKRIKIIRALLGMGSRELADKLGVSPGTLTGWEKGRSHPVSSSRKELEKLCHENGIGFLPNGFPILFNESFTPKEAE